MATLCRLVRSATKDTFHNGIIVLSIRQNDYSIVKSIFSLCLKFQGDKLKRFACLNPQIISLSLNYFTGQSIIEVVGDYCSVDRWADWLLQHQG